MSIRKLSSINRTLIKLPDLTDGYNWVKLSKEVVSTPDGNTAIYYLPVGEETAITEKEIKRYETSSGPPDQAMGRCFQFMERCFTPRKVTDNKKKWKENILDLHLIYFRLFF